MRKKRSVLILAGDITGNLGDMAIARSVCDHLKSDMKQVNIALIAEKPTHKEFFPDVEIIPKGLSGFGAFMKAAFKCHLVICGGGGLFQDDDSLIKMPYWSLRVLSVRLLRADVVGYCLGVGPLRYRISRFFCGLAFSCMSIISVRDPLAYDVAKDLTKQPVFIVPDPALALEPASFEEADGLLRVHGVPVNGSPLIGVAVRKWFHRRGSFIPHKIAFRLGLKGTGGGSKLAEMTNLLAEVLDKLVDRHDAHVVFLPTYNVDHEADDLICEKIKRKMHSNRTSLIRIADPRLYKAVTGRLSVMLGGRMHPTIFAAAMGTPVIGLGYNPKFKGFFQLIDRPDKIISIEDFVDNRMTDKLFELLDNSLKEKGSEMIEAVSGLIKDYLSFNAAVSNRGKKPLSRKRNTDG